MTRLTCRVFPKLCGTSCLALIVAACGVAPAPTATLAPTNSVLPVATVTLTSTPVPTDTATITATATQTQAPAPTETATPTSPYEVTMSEINTMKTTADLLPEFKDLNPLENPNPDSKVPFTFTTNKPGGLAISRNSAFDHSGAIIFRYDYLNIPGALTKDVGGIYITSDRMGTGTYNRISFTKTYDSTYKKYFIDLYIERHANNTFMSGHLEHLTGLVKPDSRFAFYFPNSGSFQLVDLTDRNVVAAINFNTITDNSRGPSDKLVFPDGFMTHAAFYIVAAVSPNEKLTVSELAFKVK